MSVETGELKCIEIENLRYQFDTIHTLTHPYSEYIKNQTHGGNTEEQRHDTAANLDPWQNHRRIIQLQTAWSHFRQAFQLSCINRLNHTQKPCKTYCTAAAQTKWCHLGRAMPILQLLTIRGIRSLIGYACPDWYPVMTRTNIDKLDAFQAGVCRNFLPTAKRILNFCSGVRKWPVS